MADYYIGVRRMGWRDLQSRLRSFGSASVERDVHRAQAAQAEQGIFWMEETDC